MVNPSRPTLHRGLKPGTDRCVFIWRCPSCRMFGRMRSMRKLCSHIVKEGAMDQRGRVAASRHICRYCFNALYSPPHQQQVMNAQDMISDCDTEIDEPDP